MKKRLTAALLVLAMTLCLLPLTASAANWIDYADTTWYNNNQSATDFTITTAEQLAGLASLANGGNTFSTKTVTLGADIVLNENASNYASWGDIGSAPANSWTPIGNGTYKFAGTFDGNGKTVSGIYINSDAQYVGLFGYSTGTIKNVGVIDSYIKTALGSGTAYAGGVVGNHSDFADKVANCYNTGAVSAKSSGSGSNAYEAYAGGVVGKKDMFSGDVKTATAPARLLPTPQAAPIRAAWPGKAAAAA